MVTVIPFKGIRYNPQLTDSLPELVTPPFDVIDAQGQHDFYKRHPHNMIRLVLGKTSENDSQQDNRYTRAAGYFEKWLSDEIMVQDKMPAFYLSSVEFFLHEKNFIRYGFIALVKLEPFEKGIVLPHERTFSRVKSERLDLMRACHANFSPVFSLYSDPEHKLKTITTEVCNKNIDSEFVDKDGYKHRLWLITDTQIQRTLTRAMKDRHIFIADGHHRYETALNYKKWLSEKMSGLPADHPANYVMMYLSSMEDPGLIIQSAHRMFKDVPQTKLSGFIQKAGDYFEITPLPFKAGNKEDIQTAFFERLKSNQSENAVGVFMKGNSTFYVLTIKPDVMKSLFEKELPDEIRDLDVTILTRLILIKILGFDQSRLDNEKLIGYSSSEEKTIAAVASGRCDITFILNPTTIEQLRRVAEKGLIMPRKSTYFFPKVITGLVLNRLDK